MIDTLQTIINSLPSDEVAPVISNTPSGGHFLDVLYKISTVVIASLNFGFAIYIFFKNKDDKSKTKEQDRNIALLKTLVLDYNLQYMYEAFDKLDSDLIKLKESTCDKKQVERELQKDFRILNEQFVNFLAAIDDELYKSVLEICDQCRDTIVNNISDEGVNLYVDAKYKELIKNTLDKSKKDMLHKLFSYRG